MFNLMFLSLLVADPSMREIIEQERMKVLIEQERKLYQQSITQVKLEPLFQADPPENYQKLMAQAARENRPLIILVNTDGSRNSNYLYYKTNKFESYSQPTTIISLPNQGTMFWMTTLNQYNQVEVDEFVRRYWNATMIKQIGYNQPSANYNQPVTRSYVYPGQQNIRWDCSSGVCRPVQ